MPILETRGLVRIYGRRKVVAGVSLEVDRGEVVGLLGPDRAGRTTSFRMATGQITPNEGTVSFNGEEVTELPMCRRARLGMGYLSQETSVFRKLTVEQNILAVLEMLPLCRSLGRKLTRPERQKRTEEVLEQFGLTHLRKNNAARLSGGERPRLAIARCLVCEPSLILLDEPFTGIDPNTISDIKQIVRDLARQGIGILVTDHQVREILTITDRSYIIKEGEVRTQGTPHQIINDPVAIRDYLGSSFNDNPFAAGLPPAQCEKPAENVVHEVAEQEKVHRLIEGLKSSDRATAAAGLVKRGPAVLPSLIEALERRDVEMRQQAFEVVRQILGGAALFDPYAPESLRRQQIILLRDQITRKAG